MTNKKMKKDVKKDIIKVKDLIIREIKIKNEAGQRDKLMYAITCDCVHKMSFN